jgi:hypothetical protein
MRRFLLGFLVTGLALAAAVGFCAEAPPPAPAAAGAAKTSAAAPAPAADPAPATAPAPAGAPAAKAAPGEATPVPRETLMADLVNVPQRNFDRAERLVQLFKQAGLRNVTRQSIPMKEAGGNIIATLPGQTPQTIVVAAHLDHTPQGSGVIDDWTGVVCMVNLGRSLAKTLPHHTFLFIGFDLEERGLAGSRWYLAQLPAEQKRLIVAMVDLECLGISTPKVWLTGSADALEDLARTVAAKEKQPLEFRQLYGVGADSDPFMAAGIPAITFDSLDEADFELIDSPKDQPQAIRPERLEEHYRLILKFLLALDEQKDPVSPANKDRPAPGAKQGAKQGAK